MEIFVFIAELFISIRKKYPHAARKKKSKTSFYRITAFLFIIAYFFQLINARCLCGTSNPPKLRIVGGITARPHEFPWQAALALPQGYLFCGGSLVNSRYVVTAGHCIQSKRAKQITVVLGEHNTVQPNEWRRKLKVDKLILHPEYDHKYKLNDIGLVRMARCVRFTATQKPACLLRPSINLEGIMGMVSGWGRLVEDGQRSDTLMKVKVPLISIERCRRAYGKFIVQSSVLCAMCDNGGRDACQGDSGSPMVYQRKHRSYLIGIVSWGMGCARPTHPGVYTRVDQFYSWLDTNIKYGNFCTD